MPYFCFIFRIWPSIFTSSFLGIDLDEKFIERCNTHNTHTDKISYATVDVTNINVRHEALKKYLNSIKQKQFSLVTCFSVSMWIHLHQGDDGLREWLRYVSSITDAIIIEPQPWKCYRTAAKRIRKNKQPPFPHMETIKWREKVDEEIVEYLKTECGFIMCNDLEETHWERKIVYMRKMTWYCFNVC